MGERLDPADLLSEAQLRAIRREAAMATDRSGLRARLAGLPGYRDMPELLLVDALDVVLHSTVADRALVQVLLEGALGWTEGGEPPVSTAEGPDADARWWASLASPRELEAYSRAILRQLGERPLARVAIKRLLVAMWERLEPRDRRAFLERAGVDGFARCNRDDSR